MKDHNMSIQRFLYGHIKIFKEHVYSNNYIIYNILFNTLFIIVSLSHIKTKKKRR